MKFQHVLAGLALTGSALGAEIQLVEEDFGDNPTSIQLYTYVPDRLRTPMPAIIISLHSCPSDLLTGMDAEWYAPLLEAADTAGDFIIIFPLANREKYDDGMNCWDVLAPETLTHGGVSDSTGILSALSWALDKFDGDPTRVFVTGLSSGGQMAITLAATYPENFAAIAAYSGVPFACFAGCTGEPSPHNDNSSCVDAEIEHSPEEWADFVRNAYPGYSGDYPRLMILFGDADAALKMPQLGYDTLEQWAAVLKIQSVANLSGPSVYQGEQFIELVYGDGTKLVGYLGHDVDHTVPLVPSVLLKWFGLWFGLGSS